MLAFGADCLSTVCSPCWYKLLAVCAKDYHGAPSWAASFQFFNQEQPSKWILCWNESTIYVSLCFLAFLSPSWHICRMHPAYTFKIAYSCPLHEFSPFFSSGTSCRKGWIFNVHLWCFKRIINTNMNITEVYLREVKFRSGSCCSSCRLTF